MMLVGMMRRKTKTTTETAARLAPRALLAAAARELADVQQAGRGGWTPELAGRALAALRLSGTYAMGRIAGQRLVKPGQTPVEGELLVSGNFGRTRIFASGSATSETSSSPNAPHGLSDALKTLTAARYGRTEKLDSNVDDAVATAIRITKQQRSEHSMVAEWGRNFTRSVVDLRKKVWA